MQEKIVSWDDVIGRRDQLLGGVFATHEAKHDLSWTIVNITYQAGIVELTLTNGKCRRSGSPESQDYPITNYNFLAEHAVPRLWPDRRITFSPRYAGNCEISPRGYQIPA